MAPPGSKGEKAPLPKIVGRIVMSSAEQAFLMTAVLFGLSFAAIFLFWFAEKFRPIRSARVQRDQQLTSMSEIAR